MTQKKRNYVSLTMAIVMPAVAALTFILGVPETASADACFCMYGGKYSPGACINSACESPLKQTCYVSGGNCQWSDCDACGVIPE